MITRRAIGGSSSTWFLMLCMLLLGGPSSPRAAMPQTAMPRADDARQASPASGAHLRSYVERLPAGSRIKVRLKSGESFKAILMGTADDDVIVKPRTRRPKPERRVAFAEVEFIEPEAAGSTSKVVGISIAVAAGTVAGLLFLITALYSD